MRMCQWVRTRVVVDSELAEKSGKRGSKKIYVVSFPFLGCAKCCDWIDNKWCVELLHVDDMSLTLKNIDNKWCVELLHVDDMALTLKTIDNKWCVELLHVDDMSLTLKTIDNKWCAELLHVDDMALTLKTIVRLRNKSKDLNVWKQWIKGWPS